jgi:type VI secretion system protein ImpC
MIRMPYGKNSDPCESFPFEEIEGVPDAPQMLFVNPAVLCAILLAEDPDGGAREVSDLPVYVYKEDGEAAAFPLVEIELTVDTADAVMDSGIMPVVAIRHTDKVRVLRFQTVSDPPRPLLRT